MDEVTVAGKHGCSASLSCLFTGCFAHSVKRIKSCGLLICFFFELVFLYGMILCDIDNINRNLDHKRN